MYVDVYGNEKGGVMVKKNTLRARLVKEWEKYSKKAMRDPKNKKEYAVRVRLHRVETILRERYDYMPWVQR